MISRDPQVAVMLACRGCVCAPMVDALAFSVSGNPHIYHDLPLPCAATAVTARRGKTALTEMCGSYMLGLFSTVSDGLGSATRVGCGTAEYCVVTVYPSTPRTAQTEGGGGRGGRDGSNVQKMRSARKGSDIKPSNDNAV